MLSQAALSTKCIGQRTETGIWTGVAMDTVHSGHSTLAPLFLYFSYIFCENGPEG